MIRLVTILCLLVLAPSSGNAQEHHHDVAGMGHDMSGMDMGDMAMPGLYGPYPSTREASGTAWQPDLARHEGLHLMRGSWMLMLHGMADLVHDHQGGPRGDEKLFSDNMAMLMAQRAAGPGTLGLRAMLSAEPLTIGKEGYPLLLQSGETADGRTHLIDRQHPHDLFMELAGSYSLSSGTRSLFLYAGLPGEPALGPPAFMHRFSGKAFPDAPIAHHWLDSSHITFGVVTLGAVAGGFKLEASAFRGREPDQNRFDIESPTLDSHSFRASWNPTPEWSLQISRGRLTSPEQLEPEVDVDRTTASAILAQDWEGGHAELMVAWGQNRKRRGNATEAITTELALELLGRHTLFTRLERVEKDELFEETSPFADRTFPVYKSGLGYRFDFRKGAPRIGLGATVSEIWVPGTIRDAYGDDTRAVLLFTRVAL